MLFKCINNSLLASIVILASSNANANATFYEGSNAAGFGAELAYTKNVARLSQIGLSNDEISSLFVDSGCAILFQDVDFGGQALYFGPGYYANLSSYNFNDETSSLHYLSDAQTCNASLLTFFHRHGSFSNIRFGVPLNYSNGGLPDYWNDEITGITVGKGHCAQVFEHGSYGGEVKEFDYNVANLSDYNFNDKISSFVIKPGNQCSSEAPGGGSGGGSGGGELN